MALSTTLSSVSFNAVVIYGTGSFSFSHNREAIDVSEIGAVPRTFVAGPTNATASIDIFYDQAVTSHTTLEAFIASGTITTLLITNASGMTYSALAILTSFEISGSVGDVVRAACTFQITGAVTIV
jgi:predicted secreted protein